MEKYRKIAYFGASVILVFIAFILFVKFIFPILLPFLIALFIAFISRPLVDRICRKTRLNRSAVSIIIMLLLLFFTFYILFVSVSYAVTQIGNIIATVTEQLSTEDNYITDFFSFIDGLKLRFPFLDDGIMGGESSVYSMAVDMIQEGLRSVGMRITSALARVIASLPSIIITAVVVILSLFYFAKDYDKITAYIRELLPKRMRKTARNIKNDILNVVIKYFKSYFLLFLLTFAELFVGFIILKIPNAFVLSGLIATVDILPVLGVGSVLIPWAIIVFIGGNSPLAIGLLVLYAIVYFLRQIQEPRIVGKQMNVHPVFALFTMYAGLKIGGIFGMIVGPFVAFVIKTVYDSIKNKKDIENGENM
ncbi:MAG: sporulation integral membrane protein YtvI [Clostridia bacterium]|nr:sporulation integral membrane protein YtvI [Clostridia bacterium]